MSKKCKCVLCGKEYESCNCPSDSKNNSYRIIADSVEHYQIHLIITDYVFGNISKRDAKKMLEKFNLSDYKSFNKTAVIKLDEILSEEPDITPKNENIEVKSPKKRNTKTNK